jgi:DNA-binding PadR family transcriptional regulator
MPVRTKSERATLTATECAVLGLLTKGERSGYDLAKKAERSVGYVWAPARSQIYAVLPRLVRQGLATSRKIRQSGRPDKQLYRITATGRTVARDQ